MHHLIQDRINLVHKIKNKKITSFYIKFSASTMIFDSLYEINLNLVSINSSN